MTAHRHADYVYRNADDSVRVRVFRRERGRWDYDVFYADEIETYSREAGDIFASKRDALAEANRQHGPLRLIEIKDTVVDDAWRRRAASKPKSQKTSVQLDAEIADALRGNRRHATKLREQKTYEIAFKKKGSGRLKWVAVEADNITDASMKARALMATRYPGKGYVEYGYSRDPNEPAKSS